MNSLRICVISLIMFVFVGASFALKADLEPQKDSSSSNAAAESSVEVDIVAKNKKEKLKELELLAKSFADKGFYDRAINAYNGILRWKLPKKKLFEYYVKIGDLHSLNRNYVFSFDYYKKALHIRKKSSRIMVKIGYILLEENLFTLAEKTFLDALKTDKHSIEAKIGMGNVFYKQGIYVEALQYYDKIPKKFYDREVVKKIADCYINLNKTDQAVAILESFLKERDDSELIFDLGIIYMNRSDYNTAEDLFLKYLKMNNGDFKVYVYLASLYDLKGESKKALKMFNKAYTIDSSYAVVDFMRAKVAYRSGRISEAKAYANEAYNKAKTTFVKDQIQKLVKYLNSK
ncbi:MAG: tetratricopeptide repeat protein [Endomicrobium sp.]|nr:tetratricopeptide repeat protein [Endomicrobium sp.]